MKALNPNLEEYIGRIKALPTTPGVLVKLIEFFQQPERDIDDVCKLIRQDPALTAGVLRYANSPLYAPETPIHEVFDAIAWVGFTQIYHAVVASLASQVLQLSKNGCGIDVEHVWLHSTKVGVYAGAISVKFQEYEGLPFTAGLLHDVGKIVLSLAEGEVYTAMVKEHGGGTELQKAEEERFGFSHAAVGAHLLKHWGLPEEISEPVRCHHMVGGVKPYERLCAMVCLANIMAHTEDGANEAALYAGSELELHALGVLKLSKEDLDKIRRSTQKDIKQMSGVFGMH